MISKTHPLLPRSRMACLITITFSLTLAVLIALTSSLVAANTEAPDGSVCFNNCNGHGDCIDYVCYCHVGYHGDACDTTFIKQGEVNTDLQEMCSFSK
jgi:hypothetical protein